MKGKRLIAGLCTVAIVSSVALSGCGSKDSKEAKTNDTKNTAAATTAPADDVKSSKPLTLSVEIFDRGNAPKGSTAEDNPITQWVKKEVKEKLNIDVTYIPVLRSQEYDKLNMMMASNTAPDIVFTNDAMVPKGFSQNGGLTDLGPFIEKFGKDLKKKPGADPLKFGQFNGKQYCIPSKQEVRAIHATYIRKDWVEKLGAKMPTKKEEFYTLLKRFRDEDPGKLGKGKVVPYAMAAGKTEKYYENFVLSFVKKDDRDAAIYSGILKMLRPGTKEGFKTLSQWYTEGLISKDFALDTSEKQFVQDITTGKVGAFTADQTQYLGWVDAFKKSVPDGEFWPIDAFENSEGVYYKDGGEGMALKLMVPKASEKNAEAAIRYLNWMSDKKVNTNIRYGLENVCFKYDSDGIPETIGTVEEFQAKGIADTFFGDVGILAISVDYGSEQKNTSAFLKTMPKAHQTLGAELFKILNAKGTYRRYFFPVPFEAEGKYGTNIKSMLRDSAPKIIISGADFEKVYEGEVKKAMEAGAKQLIDERTKHYDENNKK